MSPERIVPQTSEADIDATPVPEPPDRDWTAGSRIAAHPQVAEVITGLARHGLTAEVAPDNSSTGWGLLICDSLGLTVIGSPESLPEQGEEITQWCALHLVDTDLEVDIAEEVYESDSADPAPLVAAVIAYRTALTA